MTSHMSTTTFDHFEYKNYQFFFFCFFFPHKEILKYVLLETEDKLSNHGIVERGYLNNLVEDLTESNNRLKVKLPESG